MISSDDNLADRPVRKHFNGIIFSALAFMVLVVLLAALYLHLKKPAIAHPPKSQTSEQAAPSTQPQ